MLPASTDPRPGLILQHEAEGPPALFARWCESRGLPYEIQRVWEDGPPADPTDYAWICSLGSEHTPGAPEAPEWVDSEVEYLRRALAADVPILGLCFGGQALAMAAGAAVRPADPPEVGWFEIDTDDPEEVPAGPWLYFHYDQMSVPDGGEELARSPAGPAAFRLGRSLGVQFHPEGTPQIADAWAVIDEPKLERIGTTTAAVAEQGARSRTAAASAAEQLFDRWWEGLSED